MHKQNEETQNKDELVDVEKCLQEFIQEIINSFNSFGMESS